MISIATICASLILLMLERLIGIDWDYHVDSVTYIESMDNFKFHNIIDVFEISNNLHYYVVSMLGLNGTILYNILLTAIGNQLIYNSVIREGNRGLQVLLVVYLFNPYKLHLSTTLLKDSAIIFFMVVSLFSNIGLLGVLLGGAYRNAFAFYLIFHRKLKRFYLYLFTGVVSLYFYTIGFSADSLSEHLVADMTFRDFDLIPNFTDYGAIVGSLLRMIIWPIITMSGLFFLISPTINYFPLFIGSISLLLIFTKMKPKIVDLIPYFLVMSFFSIIVPGYTTYFRYVFPIIALLPFMLIYNNKSPKSN